MTNAKINESFLKDAKESFLKDAQELVILAKKLGEVYKTEEEFLDNLITYRMFKMTNNQYKKFEDRIRKSVRKIIDKDIKK